MHRKVKVLIARWLASHIETRNRRLRRALRDHRAGYIRLNTELVKKPKDLLEYVIVHEMAHLIEPTHSARFIAILDRHYPSWREARAELNELPLTAEVWKA
jgi:predicted metal-dependent hydrolase